MRIHHRDSSEVFTEVQKSGSTATSFPAAGAFTVRREVPPLMTDLENQLNVRCLTGVGKRLVTNEHGRLLYPKAICPARTGR